MNKEKQFKIEELDGKYVVMVEEPISKPFWKFWGPTTQWVKALKKNGTPCEYEKRHHADGCLRIFTMG